MTDAETPPPRWLLVEEGARAGAVLRVEEGSVLIGRDPDAGLRLDPHEDRLVSTQHALLGLSDEGWVLRDLDSRNGTFVNGERIDGRRVLHPGDRIRLGRTGPVILFTDREPTAHTEAATLEAPPTREPFASSSGRRRGAVVAAGLGAAGLALVLAWSAWAGPGREGAPGASNGPGPEETPADTDGAMAPAGGGAVAGDDGDASSRPRGSPDDRDEVIATLLDSIQGLGDELRRSRRERAGLEAELAEARRSGASDEVVADLERRLQASTAALRRQQLAASLDYDSIGRAAKPATAQVYVEFSGGRTIAATAFGVDRSGLLVTNRHVVRGERGEAVLRVGVQYAGRPGLLRAEVASVSPTSDLALLRISGDQGPFPAVTEFNARSDTLAPGSPVVLFGFPLGGDAGAVERGPPRPLVSAGILEGARGDGLLAIEAYGRGGASGSPILDSTGRVIGVLVGGSVEGERGERVFALPASSLLAFLDSAPRR